eukprot:CAMPEP_0172551004 /NCGR_PEP_ID=MMETSP1067-20121228/34941_1 /TAXON_ID=265564 ORGANISM="Thalassiosira punctigera, Strain Tpunct2005C2" /NCGR_SAMPLE_ID=MMETSP1067 /ASSEMBLY_ACC=CAM_ASM_000444 /LENGTH=133 /DNA_ID=CAMNT_0013338715 /DNA_START=80 /DNA_END=484 /DNA_ORIENTATION=+
MAKTTKKMSTKAAAKAVAKKADGKKKRSRTGKSSKPNFNTYIYRVLKETHPEIGITKRSMGIMNDFVNDMMDRLASEAKTDLSITGKKKTLSEWHFKTAAALVLPGELKKHGWSEGSKAVYNFNKNRKKSETR